MRPIFYLVPGVLGLALRLLGRVSYLILRIIGPLLDLTLGASYRMVQLTLCSALIHNPTPFD